MSYYSREYTRGIKSILSERIAKDFNLLEDRVTLGYGAEDLLKQAIQCYLAKDNKIMIPAYSWWYYKAMADEVGGLNVEYPLYPGKDSFHYDIDGMIELYEKENPTLVFISTPNNPTGNSLPLEKINLVLEKMKDTIVVIDEAYAYSGKTNYVEEMINRYPNLLVIRTFSKYYALAGIRIGFALLGKNISGFSKFTNRYLGYNRLSEDIALAALDSPDYYADISQKLKEDKQIFYNELAKFPGFKVFKSDANFILVEIPGEIKSALKEFLTKKGMIIKFMNEKNLNTHIRITLGTQEQNRLLISAMKEYVTSAVYA